MVVLHINFLERSNVDTYVVIMCIIRPPIKVLQKVHGKVEPKYESILVQFLKMCIIFS